MKSDSVVSDGQGQEHGQQRCCGSCVFFSRALRSLDGRKPVCTFGHVAVAVRPDAVACERFARNGGGND